VVPSPHRKGRPPHTGGAPCPHPGAFRGRGGRHGALPNRRLYGRSEGRYVTLRDVEGKVRRGLTVTVRASKAGEASRAALTQNLLEPRPGRMELFPASFLHLAIRADEAMLGPLAAYVRQSLADAELPQHAAPVNPLLAPQAWPRAFLPNLAPHRGPGRLRRVEAAPGASCALTAPRRPPPPAAGRAPRLACPAPTAAPARPIHPPPAPRIPGCRGPGPRFAAGPHGASIGRPPARLPQRGGSTDGHGRRPREPVAHAPPRTPASPPPAPAIMREKALAFHGPAGIIQRVAGGRKSSLRRPPGRKATAVGRLDEGQPGRPGRPVPE
jgi:PHB/PHA accumulation regulator DNA-binding domain